MYDEMLEGARDFRNFSGEELMQKREVCKVSEFLEQLKIGFGHGV